MGNRVLAVGEALIDLVAARPGELTKTSGFVRKMGGAPLNVMAAANIFGAKSELFATVGNDFFGDFILRKFSKYSSTKNIIKVDKFTTLAFVSLTKDGERDFEFSRGADAELTYDHIDKEIYNDSEIIVFSSATAFIDSKLKETYFKLVDKSASDKKIVVFDPNYRENLINDLDLYAKDIRYVFSKSDIIKLSDEEALMITGESSIDNAIKELSKSENKTIFVTLGKKGFYLISNGKSELHKPIITVNSIDTTGAGDVFLGCIIGLISKIEDKRNITDEEILKIAKKSSIAAALSTTKKGALSAIPSMKEVERYSI
ncbi:MAG: carbohydrate kinase [Mycoplasmataceae bacterium]|nr:carbohydrate kinase [Mycoplasmataceae bacterium]